MYSWGSFGGYLVGKQWNCNIFFPRSSLIWEGMLFERAGNKTHAQRNKKKKGGSEVERQEWQWLQRKEINVTNILDENTTELKGLFFICRMSVSLGFSALWTLLQHDVRHLSPAPQCVCHCAGHRPLRLHAQPHLLLLPVQVGGGRLAAGRTMPLIMPNTTARG